MTKMHKHVVVVSNFECSLSVVYSLSVVSSNYFE